MQSFGWSVSAPYSGCDASGHRGYYFWHWPGDGHISTSLPTGYSFFSITYGSSCYGNGASVQVKLNGRVVDSVDDTCADGTAQAGKCYVYPPVASCLKTFSGAYNPGDVLQVIELSSIAYIMSINLAHAYRRNLAHEYPALLRQSIPPARQLAHTDTLP